MCGNDVRTRTPRCGVLLHAYTASVLVVLTHSIFCGNSQGQNAVRSYGINGPDPMGQISKVGEDAALPRVDGGNVEYAEWSCLMTELHRTNDVNCGAACLHTLLRLKGISVDKKTIYKTVAVTKKGASLAELQSVALDFGMPCDVLQVSVKQLGKLRPPLILHFQVAKNHPGHYVVLFGRNSSGAAELIDPTTGTIRSVTDAMLHEAFSGYVLIPVPGLRSIEGVERLFVVGSALGLLFLVRELWLRWCLSLG